MHPIPATRPTGKWPTQFHTLLIKFSSDRNWGLLLATVFLITFATRFYKVTEPDHIW